jgi:glycosyltransferase involved in cell wall biosynthesis
MKVAVITPYHNCPRDWIAVCVESVQSQYHPCEHIVVCDGDDSFPPALQHQELQLIHLPRAHRDYGNTARAIGSISAFRRGFDAVAWLDADNWYKPEHIASLLEVHKNTSSAICFSKRDLYHLNGTYLGPCPETARGELIDTNCYLIVKQAKEVISAWWMMDEKYNPVGDRYFYTYLKHIGMQVAGSNKDTVCYRTAYAPHYEHFGVAVPAEAKEVTRVKE